MLLNLREYHRPGNAAGGVKREGLEQALALLARSGGQTVPLAGGDTLLASGDPAIEAVVDLQGLGLDRIMTDENRLEIGAMATRAQLAEQANAFEGLANLGTQARNLTSLGVFVAQAAARWGGNVQRNRATVGGAVAVAAPDDLLVLALLAANASIILETVNGSRTLALADFLPNRKRLLAQPALITGVVVAPDTSSWLGATTATVARTPSDQPIVAAVAVVERAGERCMGATLALGGVGKDAARWRGVELHLVDTPWSQELVARTAEDVSASVQPLADFRGSAEYRRAMAKVLSGRALAEAWERAV